MGQVLSIGDFRRSDVPSSHEDARMEGFRHALSIVRDLNMKPESWAEAGIAIENWSSPECGKVAVQERDAFFECFGWGRR